MNLYPFFIFTLLISMQVSSTEIEFNYSRDIDRQCERESKSKVSKKSIRELDLTLPKLRKVWEQDAPMFYKAIRQTTGKALLAKKIHGAVFICFQPSFSIPLKLWVGAYLPSYRGGVRSSKYFSNLVLHEILHIFVVENLKGKKTKFLKKYADESQITKAHLHVMAMQKAIYLHLGLKKRLREHMEKEISFGGGYARSWEIINNIEGHQPFVNELVGDSQSKFYKASLLERILKL